MTGNTTLSGTPEQIQFPLEYTEEVPQSMHPLTPAAVKPPSEPGAAAEGAAIRLYVAGTSAQHGVNCQQDSSTLTHIWIRIIKK